LAKYLRNFVPMGKKDVILDRIRKSIDAGISKGGNASSQRRIVGWVWGNTFRVRVRQGFSRNLVVPVLRGKVEEIDGGIVVRARLGWTFFTSGLAIVSITALIVVIGLELAGYRIFTKEGKSRVEGVIPLFFALMVVIGWFTLSGLAARSPEEELFNWFEQVCSPTGTQ
jgi:hypothetical protein